MFKKFAIGLSMLLSSVCHAGLMGSGGDVTYRVDTSSAALSVLADPAGGATAVPLLIGLATDKDGVVWGLDVGGWPTLAAELVSFDETGAVASTAQITYQGAPVLVAEGLTFAPNGRAWISFGAGADYEFFQSGHLGAVDTATGIIDPASVVTLSGYHNVDADSLEFVGGSLYMTDNLFGLWTNLYTVDLTSGVPALVGKVENASGAFQVTDLAADGNTLYGETYSQDGTGRLITINRNSGAASTIGAPHSILNGLTTIADDTCDKKKCK